MRIRISTLSSLKSTKPKFRTAEFADLAQGFVRNGHLPRAYKNHSVAYFNLTHLEGGRKKENIKVITGLVLDSDGDITFDEVQELLTGFEYLYYTSFSHLEDGKTERFKIVLPFDKPCDLKDWDDRAQGARNYFRGFDFSSLVPTQFQAMPNCPKSRKKYSSIRYFRGERFDWRLIPIVRDEPQPEKSVSAGLTNGVVTEKPTSGRIVDPDTTIHHRNGFIRAGDINGHIRDIFCPVHDDKNPTEFANVNSEGHPYIVCSTCGTLWIKSPAKSAEDPIFPEIGTSVKTVDTSKPVKKPVSWQQNCEILTTNQGQLAEINLLYGPEGSGKSYLAYMLCQQGKKVLFACRSNKQAEEKYESLSKLGIRVALLSSRSHEIEKRFGVKPTRFAKTHPWDEGRINEAKTYEAIVKQNPDLAEHHASDLLTGLVNERIDWHSVDMVITTHARLGALGRMNISNEGSMLSVVVPDDVIVFYDDPELEDFMTLATFSSALRAENVFGQKIERYYPKNADQIYLVKPHVLRPGFGFQKHQIVFTTTELIIMALIKMNNPAIRIHDDLLPSNAKIFGGNVHLISTKLVRSTSDGLLPPIMERVRRHGFDFEYIANGQGCEVNLSNNKGMNSFMDANTVIEVSVPTKEEISTLYEQFNRMVPHRKLKLLIMLDRIHQAVGRNSGYRWQGKECVVLVDPMFFKLVQQYSRYSFESVIEADKENPDTFPMKQPSLSTLHQAVGWYINRHEQYIRNGNAFKFDCQRCLSSTRDALRPMRLKRLITGINALIDNHPTMKEKLERVKLAILPQ